MPAAEVALEQYLHALCAFGVVVNRNTTRELLRDLFRGIDLRGARVLDVGGGEGLCSFYAALCGAREVVCLEPEAAGSSARITSLLERIRGALPRLPVRPESKLLQHFHDAEGFDVVLMNASINHVDEEACIRLHRDAAAREAYGRVFGHMAGLARRGARLVVADCTRYNFFAALGCTNPLFPAIEWQKHQAPGLWARLLQEAGFRRPRVSWRPIYRFGAAGRLLTANRAAAYFLKSMFRLEMERG